MAKQILLCKSKNEVKVTYDPVDSHASTHLDDTPDLEGLVKELIGTINLNRQEVGAHFDMGRIVGTTDVVNIDASDEIVYAVRRNRRDDGLVPSTKSRPAEPCKYVSVHLLPQSDGTYVLSSAWIGTFGDDEPFPLSPLATASSKDYWDTHAFVWGSQGVEPGIVTSSRPW